jgi:hypothetical protein
MTEKNWVHVKATECHGDYVEDARTGITVADLYRITPTGNIVHYRDSYDHAVLIAAGPDMLAALKMVCHACGGHENWNGKTREFLVAAETAIAKAEGKG